MNLKKVLAMLVLVALCVTLVAGCGGDPVTSDVSADGESMPEGVSDVESAPVVSGDGATTSAGNTTSTKKTTAKTTKKNSGFLDDGGNGGDTMTDDTVIEGLPALSSKVTNKTVKLLTHVYPNSSNKKITSKYIKQYDLTVEHIVVPYASKVTRLIQMIAANDSPDVVGMDETYLTILHNNLAQPTEEYIDYSDKVWDDVRKLHEARKWKGKIYEVIIHAVPSRILWYNAKLFKAQALKTPVEYYDAGNWNWNTFLDVAKKLTVDLNNDGVIDQYGFGGESLQFMFFGAVNESFVKADANGKLANNMRSANIAKAMNMFADVQLNEGIYCPSPSFEKLMNNQMAMGYYGTWNLSSAEDKVKAGDLAWAPAPSAPGMKNYNFPTYESNFIPKGAKNPHGAGAYMTYNHYLNAANAKKENTSITKEMQRMYDAARSNLVTTVTNRDLKAGTSVEWAACSSLSKGSSWSSVLEEYSPMLDAALADLPSN
ncbi:MAG: extracellular solute-binding protein [Clostridia bacterium]|nr:extracellular solute-binding protein [Clostridia bacterium]